MRRKKEILEAEKRLDDRVWYERYKLSRKENQASGPEKAKKIEQTYSKDELAKVSDFEWGMINGKLSALRWVLGDEWDILET